MNLRAVFGLASWDPSSMDPDSFARQQRRRRWFWLAAIIAALVVLIVAAL